MTCLLIVVALVLYLLLRSPRYWCERCQHGHKPWCPGFVLWSADGVIDHDMDSCDVCGFPRADHPVMHNDDQPSAEPTP